MKSLVEYIQKERAKIQPPRILIVESDTAVAALLQEHLGREYDVIVTENGRDAIARCQQKSPQLILIDTNLPDMPALALFQQLYNFKLIHRIPILFLGQSDDSHQVKMAALDAGVDDYIPKPFDVLELQLRLKNALPPSRQSVDMITGLPDWQAVEEELAYRLTTPAWTLSLFVIEHLRAYHFLNGAIATNNVRRAVGNGLLDLVDELGDFDDFVGAIGPQAFILVAKRPYHEQISLALRRRFHAERQTWYPPDVLAHKFVTLPNGKRAPLITLSATAVPSRLKSFTDALDILAVAEKLRARARAKLT
ncbi:MAG TPA: response regulator transcription factor [Anaerolineae bacterium]|nr:response regulator transcription factor [Anaerolineae bacterium]HIP70944.1 response regulator transcription factor [Anaerolineae bacterium]